MWDLPRKQSLIDSILRGWRLPKFYFATSAYDVVDGQQRLATSSSSSIMSLSFQKRPQSDLVVGGIGTCPEVSQVFETQRSFSEQSQIARRITSAIELALLNALRNDTLALLAAQGVAA